MERRLFSAAIFGAASLPACSVVQAAETESNSSVKNMGKGVAVGSCVGVGDGVLVGGIGDGEGVSVGAGVATSGAGVADWQAVMNRRSPMISFFMAPIKTQLPGRLFQAIEILGDRSGSIAVGNAHKTGPLVHDQADDACCEEERNYDDDDQMEGMRKQVASGPQGADDWPTGNDPRR